MSQSPPNYMENIPVKISERYKPPPKVSLPQSVCQRLNADNVACLNLTYDFSLEKNVLTRIDEWKKMREVERDTRRERMRKREAERLRLEEQQKTLLTAVSYPSTEELSSEDEAKDSAGAASNAAREANAQTVEVCRVASPAQMQYNHSQHTCFDTILTPTVVLDSYNRGGYNNQVNKQSLSKINYSDFENDSSPFDNVELKTINDLDILAQVLNITQLHSSTSTTSSTSNQNHEKSLSPSEINQRLESTSNNANSTQASQEIYSQVCENSENCNITIAETATGTATTFPDPLTHNAYAAPPSNMQNANHFYSNYNSSVMQNSMNMNGVAKPSDFYYYPQHLPQQAAYDNYMYSNINYPLNLIQSNENSSSVMEATTTAASVAATKNAVTFRDIDIAPKERDGASSVNVKNKSKSVPDILRELNEEIRDSENRRIRNNSQCIENQERKPKDSFIAKTAKPVHEMYMKLSPSSQALAKNISSMGFPLELVSRIAERVGNDDKKIVEHLIPLSELLDLGFDESIISDALLKFDNNKEKALDFLIS